MVAARDGVPDGSSPFPPPVKNPCLPPSNTVRAPGSPQTPSGDTAINPLLLAVRDSGLAPPAPSRSHPDASRFQPVPGEGGAARPLPAGSRRRPPSPASPGSRDSRPPRTARQRPLRPRPLRRVPGGTRSSLASRDPFPPPKRGTGESGRNAGLQSDPGRSQQTWAGVAKSEADPLRRGGPRGRVSVHPAGPRRPCPQPALTWMVWLGSPPATGPPTSLQ